MLFSADVENWLLRPAPLLRDFMRNPPRAVIASGADAVGEAWQSTCETERVRWNRTASSLRVFCEAKDEAISLTILDREIASLLAPLAPRNDGSWDDLTKWIATRCCASLAMTMPL